MEFAFRCKNCQRHRFVDPGGLCSKCRDMLDARKERERENMEKGKVSESIYHGTDITIPLAEVAFIRIDPDRSGAIRVYIKDAYARIKSDDVNGFFEAWTTYRYEVEGGKNAFIGPEDGIDDEDDDEADPIEKFLQGFEALLDADTYDRDEPARESVHALFKKAFDEVAREVSLIAEEQGFAQNIAGRNIVHALAETGAELASAYTAFRNGPERVDSTTGVNAIATELADVVLWLMFIARRFELDIPKAVAARLKYHRSKGYPHGGEK